MARRHYKALEAQALTISEPAPRISVLTRMLDELRGAIPICCSGWRSSDARVRRRLRYWNERFTFEEFWPKERSREARSSLPHSSRRSVWIARGGRSTADCHDIH